MSENTDLAELIGRTADERLLEDLGKLPFAVGRPEPMPPPSVARRRLVGAGATLTGVTLLVGIALIGLGIGEAVSNAIILGIGLLATGIALVATHWGWVHVAEWTADSIERRRDSQALERRRWWLRSIEPYRRYEIATTVEEDGSIRIVRTAHTPVLTGTSRFVFERRVEHEEVHSPDEPGAAVTERAELLRLEAAADTERERLRFETAADAYQTALLRRDDADQQREARRAASQALSEQINSNLRDPPLVE